MKFKTLAFVYLTVLAAQCFAVGFGVFSLQIFTKPLLMAILIFYFANASRRLHAARHVITAALGCWWFGDVFLLFDKRSGGFFIFGLLAFLVAHLFYIFYFRRVARLNEARTSLNIFAAVGVAVYVAAFYYALFPHLAELKIPVLIYSSVIGLMLTASFHAFGKIDDSAKICIAGAILFAVSDSILAYNRFISPSALAPVLVMLTYGIAQLLIAEGGLRNLRELEKRKSEDDF